MDIPKESKRGLKILRRGFILTVGAVILIGVTVGVARLKEADRQIDEDLLWIGVVERGEFVRQVRGSGVLVPKEEWWLSAPGDGTVANVLIEPGQRVDIGQPILTLTNPVLEQEVQDAKWKLQAAEAELENQTAQLESQELDSEDAIVTLQAQLHVANLEATRDLALFKEGILGEHQAKTSEAKEDELETRLELAKRRLKQKEAGTKAALAVQEATVEQLSGMLALKEKQRTDLVVTSNEPGIMKQLLVEIGQQVTSGTTLAHMADPNELKAELNIPETQIRDVANGQPVIIDTRNGKIDGKVARIDPAVVNGTVNVEVTLTGELPKSARPDLSVEGRIELERRPDVLHVERPVSSREDAPMEVFLIARNTGVAERKLIRLGRSSVNTIEILDGLEPGDEIILSDMSKYEGDDRIRLR